MDIEITKRGLCSREARTYLGIGRREFDTNWRPHLSRVAAGVRVLFDIVELDRLFEERKLSPSASVESYRVSVSGLKPRQVSFGNMKKLCLSRAQLCSRQLELPVVR